MVLFDGTSFSPTTLATGLTVTTPGASGEIAAGSTLMGFTITENSKTETYYATHWTQSPSPSETEAKNSAYTFTITVDSGYTVELTQFGFDFGGNGAGPKKLGVYVLPSTSGIYAQLFDQPDVDTGAGGVDAPDFDLDFSATGSLSLSGGQSASFYIVGYDAHQPDKFAWADNITLTASGSGPAVPEPSSFAAIAGLGALGFVATRRRRRRV